MKKYSAKSYGGPGALSSMIDTLSGKPPKVVITISKGKLDFTAKYNALSFLPKLIRHDRNIELIDYDSNSDGSQCFGYSHWIEVKDHKNSRTVRIDLSECIYSKCSEKRLVEILSCFDIVDWDTDDI